MYLGKDCLRDVVWEIEAAIDELTLTFDKKDSSFLISARVVSRRKLSVMYTVRQ